MGGACSAVFAIIALAFLYVVVKAGSNNNTR